MFKQATIILVMVGWVSSWDSSLRKDFRLVTAFDRTSVRERLPERVVFPVNMTNSNPPVAYWWSDKVCETPARNSKRNVCLDLVKNCGPRVSSRKNFTRVAIDKLVQQFQVARLMSAWTDKGLLRAEIGHAGPEPTIQLQSEHSNHYLAIGLKNGVVSVYPTLDKSDPCTRLRERKPTQPSASMMLRANDACLERSGDPTCLSVDDKGKLNPAPCGAGCGPAYPTTCFFKRPQSMSIKCN